MMEERRLLYVGITRAKDLLHLVYAQNRSAFGYAEPAIPSRFLDDIPEQLLDQSQPRRVENRSVSLNSQPERWQIPEPTQKPLPRPSTSQFRPGMRVQHPTWGEGMVLKIILQDGDEVVDVFFADIGLKRVVASLARLEIKPAS